MKKTISLVKSDTLLTGAALVLLLNLSFSPEASALTIGFEDLTAGTPLLDQYSAKGIYFRDQLSLSGSSPGVIAASGYGSAMALQPNHYETPMYILLNTPVASFNFYKYEWSVPENPAPEEVVSEVVTEQPQEAPVEEVPTEEAPQEAPSEDYTVHLEFFKFDGSAYQSLGTMQNSDKDAWVPVSFTSSEQISAIMLYGTHPYIVDTLQIGTTPDPVPEPATMLLFATGIVGLVGSRLRRKKP